MTTPKAVKIHQGSLKIHPQGVKHGIGQSRPNIKKNNNSLSMFLPFTRTPSRDARPRIRVCVRDRVGERVKHHRQHCRCVRHTPEGAAHVGPRRIVGGEVAKDANSQHRPAVGQAGASASVAGPSPRTLGTSGASWPEMAAGTITSIGRVCLTCPFSFCEP